MVLADFLMSPEAQARKQDPRVWGGPTVLDLAKLTPQDRERFAALPLGVATLAPDKLGRVLPEPHPSWVERLEKEWRRRYAAR
jgi:putative thiamine transport system substrate-binding protein